MNQKGASLVYAMLAVAVGAGAIASLTLVQRNRRLELKLYKRQLQRDALARDLGNALVNPLVLLKSVTDGKNLQGNSILANCLGNPSYPGTNKKELDTATLRENVMGGSGCTIPDTVNGMEFLLIPEQSFWRNNCTQAQKDSVVTSRPLSCFLAGNRNGQRIAYNFQGDASLRSADEQFPLEARVYFRPTCRKGTTQRDCQFAEEIEFRYEIQQKVQVPDQPTLGTYPIQQQWLKLDTATIVGMQCNTGAIALKTSVSSGFECVCYRPYRQVVENGLPLHNAQGPLCETFVDCPPGFIMQGRDKDSKPICAQMRARSVALPGDTFRTDDNPLSPHGCNEDGSGGWVSNIQRTCYSQFNLQYQQCEAGCSTDWWPIAVGAVASLAALMAIAIALTILAGIPVFGTPFIPLALAAQILASNSYIMLGIASLGAFAGYMLNQSNYDWIYYDPIYGHKPHVYCKVTLECGNVAASGSGSGSSSGTGSSSGSGSGSSSYASSKNVYNRHPTFNGSSFTGTKHEKLCNANDGTCTMTDTKYTATPIPTHPRIP